jgi:hypothetical protein
LTLCIGILEVKEALSAFLVFLVIGRLPVKPFLVPLPRGIFDLNKVFFFKKKPINLILKKEFFFKKKSVDLILKKRNFVF